VTAHVYAGPTITAKRIHEILPAAVVHPPIRHGDLSRLDPSPSDRVLIIDGLWHQVAPVRHKEILEVLARGAAVVGAASMGALRAAELHTYGMAGVGWVYEAYRDGTIDADDEVAVIQTPDGQPLSEALINIRAAAQVAHQAGVLTSTEAARLLAEARNLPYPQRRWEAIGRTTERAGLGEAFGRFDAWRRHHPCDVKRRDAEQALTLLAQGELPPPDTNEWRCRPWRTSFVRYWTARFRSELFDDTPVPFLAILQHQQLYDPRFPVRWRALVLSWIAGDPPRAIREDAADLEARALAAAATRGVASRHLTAGQLAYWLTPVEVRNAPRREALLRIIVRSARLDSAATIWPTNRAEAGDLLNPAIPSGQITASAFNLNDRVGRAAAGRTIHHLRPDRIRAQLADVWGARPAEDVELNAHARDRGFQDMRGAVEVARSFYLWARTHSCYTDLPARAGA
jgi:hypothetical protein